MEELQYKLNLDAPGIFWVVFCCSWTAILAAGASFLWRRRDMPLLKVRGLGFSLSAVACLHVYWMAVQFAYIVLPFPKQAEYWIMGIYLPFGIALFHAANSRFLHVAREQRKFLLQAGGISSSTSSSSSAGENEKIRRPVAKFDFLKLLTNSDRTQKALVIIGVGMFVQLVLTVVMYLLSRKFHPSFGLPGTEAGGSPWDVNRKQGIGWEWWPSVVWQFFWSWIVAPVVLWRARRVHDTLGWRTQTVACCLAGLPATPMWLVALYVPAMNPVNRYWIAPQWIAVSIFLMEIFTVFFPCWQVHKHQALRQETLDTISAWESRFANRGFSSESVAGESSRQDWTTSTMSEPDSKPLRTMDTIRSDASLFSMGALERLLENNPEPLRQFSALKDFSGENVAFLAAVAEWKRGYPAGQEKGLVQNAYARALGIYTKFISPRYAEFPINISFQEMAGLDSTFAEAARISYGAGGVIRGPASQLVPPGWPRSPGAVFLGAETKESQRTSVYVDEDMHELQASLKRVSYCGEIPAGFSAACFDQVENSIKYLVLTNTWPKFLQDSRRSSDLSSTVREGLDADGRGRSIGSRLASILSCDI